MIDGAGANDFMAWVVENGGVGWRGAEVTSQSGHLVTLHKWQKALFDESQGAF